MAPTRNQRTPHRALPPHLLPEPTDIPEGSQGGKIPRPSNAWILYRTEHAARLKAEKLARKEPPYRQSMVSKIVGQQWRAEPQSVRNRYEKEAARLAEKHAEMYPEYKFQPVKKEVRIALREEEARQKKLLSDAKKAAKESGRKASPRASSSRRASAEAAPVQAPAPRRASTRSATKAQRSASSTPAAILSAPQPREPISRGSGASPPLESDDDSSTLSSTSSLSFDGDTLLHLPYPMQAAMSGFAPLPMPDFGQVIAPGFSQTDNVCYLSPDFLQQGPSGQVMVMGADGTLSTSLSTPGDSPPSYSEGNQFDALNMRCEWVGGPPMAFNDPQRPFPAHLPIAMPGQMLDVEDVLRALERAPSMGAWAAPPPMDVDMQLAHLLSSPQSATCYPHGDGSGDDALARAMNIADVQEVMDSSSSGAATNESSFDGALDVNPRSFEDTLEFQDTFPETAGHVMDPNEFYSAQAAEAAAQYPELADNLGLYTPTTTFSMDDMGLQWYSNADAMDDFFAGVPLESHDASGPSSGARHSHSGPPTPTQHDAFYGASLPPTPTVDYSAFASSVSPSPFASSVAPSPVAPTPSPSPYAPTPMSTPVVETTDFGSAPVDNTPAMQRYVPPGGAGQASRRRVGQRFPRPPFVPGQAQGSGSGSSST